MSWPPRPTVTVTVPWLRAIRELFSSERTLSSEGAGHNLVEAIVMLAHSIDRAAAAIEQFNEER